MKIILSSLTLLILTSCATGPKTLSKKEREADIYFDAGTEALYAGKYTDALNAFLLSVKADPSSAEAWNNLGLAYFQKNQPAKAEESWKKALSENKDFSDARNNLGLLYMRQKKFKAAEEAFKTVTADILYNKAFQANYNLGLLYEQQGKITQAEQQFTLSTQGDPTFCPAWYKLAKINKDRGDLNTAETAFKKSVSGTCYSNPEAHFEIGSIYLKTNDVSKAKSKFLEVIEFFPKSDWAKKAEVTLNMIR